ncbi:hypothetical protein Ahy_A10g051180 isoform A [Arachis hypogaea]|uniref:F-box domain-containing protein n=2 Tax=Arachis hypogaea TaxID=3818 RepID=A0A445BBW2_ARAHY|nr:hypothetical protein Ahy_A10g051180 isoform A [Arachis hypogaea]
MFVEGRMSNNEECKEMKRTKSDEWEVVEWCNLPGDLLSRIASYLELIDFLSFRSVCKEWLIPPSEYNPSCRELWFLLYGEGSQCSFLKLGSQSPNSERLYTVNFPELDGATCLASYLGWLLLVQEGAMFFFCPFSRAKIDLPDCPFTDLSEHVAAFSADPTCQDCVVVVVSRKSEVELELHLLRRGNKEWHKHCHRCVRSTLNTVSGAAFSEEKFQFLDADDGLVTFNADGKSSKSWANYRIVNHGSSKDVETLEYHVRKNMFGVLNIGQRLGFRGGEDDVVSISICGTMILGIQWLHILRNDSVILSETIVPDQQHVALARQIKGVWIQPRYVQVPPGLTW